MLTLQLTSTLWVYLAGALDTALMRMKTADTHFDEGAIAFHEDEFGFHTCRIVRKKLSNPGQPQLYVVRSSSALFLDIPTFELWTGWEDDFPSWSDIDWGQYVNWDEEQVEELLADDETYPGANWNPHEKWQPDDDYYTQLAEEYEIADH